MTRAVFPGSFDPLTVGHVDIINRAAKLFGEIIIGIGTNANKSYMFSKEQRADFIKQSFADNSKIKVMHYDKLTIDFCKKMEAGYIIRGLRNGIDYEYESAIAQMNRELNSDVETIFITCSPLHVAVSSTIVRDIIRNGGDASKFLTFKL